MNTQSKETFSYVVEASTGNFCIKTVHNHNARFTDDLFRADKCSFDSAAELMRWFEKMKPEFTYKIVGVTTKTEMRIHENQPS